MGFSVAKHLQSYFESHDYRSQEDYCYVDSKKDIRDLWLRAYILWVQFLRIQCITILRDAELDGGEERDALVSSLNFPNF